MSLHDLVKVGTDMGTYEYRLAPWRILRYIETTDDKSCWYSSSSPFGEPVAPASICDCDTLWLPGYQKLWNEWFPKMGRVFQSHQEFEFLNPALPNKKIRVSGKVIDNYQKGQREYCVIESVSVDEDDRHLIRARLTICWPILSVQSEMLSGGTD